MKNDEFIQLIWDKYAQHQRNDLPWRLPDAQGQFDAYHVLVSEIMLQQTQVTRVVPKYLAFLSAFPDPAAPLVLYCGGGNRSALAAQSLQILGYQQVHSLQGGFRGWLASDGDVVVDVNPALD